MAGVGRGKADLLPDSATLLKYLDSEGMIYKVI